MAKTTTQTTPAGPTLAIGMLVKNRAWALPDVLACFDGLTWPAREQIAVHLVDDGSADGGADIMAAWADANRADYHSITITTLPAVAANVSSRDAERPYIFAHLADLRNIILDWAREIGATWYLDTDSDTLFAPTLISDLAALNVPISVPVVTLDVSGPMVPQPGEAVGVFNIGGDHCTIPACSDWYWGGPPITRDCAGSITLYSADVLGKPSIRYAAHKWGEYVGFAESALAAGYRGVGLPSLLALHVMRPGDIDTARALACETWGARVTAEPTEPEWPAAPTEATEGSADE